MLERSAASCARRWTAIGAQEVLFPALLPREPYEATGRWTEYGDGIFRLKDRKGNDYLLGPTHEELFTLMVKGEYSSYKDLPVTLYQIQNKYRDEARPRAGILRGREFVMKDSYSFDVDDEGLQASYDAHRVAYLRIFERLGMDYRIVSAVSGAMGGSASEEFLAPTPTGEDTYVACTSCDYAANVEACDCAPPSRRDPARSRRSRCSTPLTRRPSSRSSRAADLGHDVDAAQTLKNVVLQLRNPDGTTELLVVGVPGDRDVDLKRLEANVFPAEVEPFERLRQAPGAGQRLHRPAGAARLKIRYVVDPRVIARHGLGDRRQRAGQARASTSSWAATSSPPASIAGRPGPRRRPVPALRHPLEINRGIEIGHVFQLGRKFADALGLTCSARTASRSA